MIELAIALIFFSFGFYAGAKLREMTLRRKYDFLRSIRK